MSTENEQPQLPFHRFPLTFSLPKDAFQYIPDEILMYIFDFLPLKSQLSLSSVSPSWHKKHNLFRQKNLGYSKKMFLDMTLNPSEVSFKDLCQTIDHFTNYWTGLCENSNSPSFLNERPKLEASLGLWLTVNAEQITSHEWNTTLNQEIGEKEYTYTYAILRRLLLSPFFVYTLKHQIWEMMAEYNETRIRLCCDVLSQIPIVLGKSVFHYISKHIETENNYELIYAAVGRGIELDLQISPSAIFNFLDNSMYTNVLLQKLFLYDANAHVDAYDDGDAYEETLLRGLDHIDPIITHIKELESIILLEIEAGSFDVLKDGFIYEYLNETKEWIEVEKEKLVANEFELVHHNVTGYESYRPKSYIKPIMPYLISRNPYFLPFLFRRVLKGRKTLAGHTILTKQKRREVLLILCSFIPENFDYGQIDIAEVACGILTSIKICQFKEATKEEQIEFFRNNIKSMAEKFVLNWKAKCEANNFARLEQELKSSSLFFKSSQPLLPFLYYPTETEVVEIKDEIGIYILTKIGYLENYEFSQITLSARSIPANLFTRNYYPPCRPRVWEWDIWEIVTFPRFEEHSEEHPREYFEEESSSDK